MQFWYQVHPYGELVRSVMVFQLDFGVYENGKTTVKLIIGSKKFVLIIF